MSATFPLPGIHYHIQVSGGTLKGKRLLSSDAKGHRVTLTNEDDGSGRQRWVFHHIRDNFFTVTVAGGIASTDRIFLSTNREGSLLDLYREDDHSGRQLWVLQPLDSGSFNIFVQGGTVAGHTFLSASAQGNVDLWERDDFSGRQRWVIKPVVY